MNSVIFSADDINTFLTLFLTLAGVSLLAVPTTALVSRTSKSLVALAGAILTLPVTTDTNHNADCSKEEDIH